MLLKDLFFWYMICLILQQIIKGKKPKPRVVRVI